MSHEFQVLADSGEDAIVACTKCSYAANVEKAGRDRAPRPLEQVERAAEERRDAGPAHDRGGVAFLGASPDRFIKTLVFADDPERRSWRWCAATTRSREAQDRARCAADRARRRRHRVAQ